MNTTPSPTPETDEFRGPGVVNSDMLLESHDRLERQRNELRDALEALLTAVDTHLGPSFARSIQPQARAALANASQTACNGCARKRKPRPAPTDVHGKPAPFTAQELEDRIDDICRRGGRRDRDRVSIFNRAAVELWTERNTALANAKK